MVRNVLSLSLFRRTENKTTIATCTKKGAALVNDLAAEVLFKDRKQKALACIPMDWELNTDNFELDGTLKEDVVPKPKMQEIYKGMRLSLTKNMDKRHDFVNGMGADVLDYHEESRCLSVRTVTGKDLAVHLVTEKVDGRNVVSFPVRLGYAGTVQRIQGMTLEHVTLWLDRAGCRAAGYVALSRVQYDKDYLIAGLVAPRHFVPAM